MRTVPRRSRVDRRKHLRTKAWEQLLATTPFPKGGYTEVPKEKWWTEQCPPTCRRKRPWPTEEVALQMLGRMMLTRPLDGQPVPYKCNQCGFWYLGRPHQKHEGPPQ